MENKKITKKKLKEMLRNSKQKLPHGYEIKTRKKKSKK